MKFDLDAIQNDTLDITLGGEVYKVQQLDTAAYISASKHKEKVSHEAGADAANLKVFNAWIGALAPELPADKVKSLSLRAMNALLSKLDTFQGGVVGDVGGNVPAGGGKQ